MVLAVPAPPTRAAGIRLTAAIWKADVTDGVTFLANPPLLEITQSSAQALANSTVTTLAFDTTITDTYGGHSNVTNNSRYTPTVAGWYLCFGMCSFASNVTGGRDLEFRKNGVGITIGQGSGQGAAGGINTTITAWALIQCDGSSDYIELAAFQTSGGALNTVPSNTGLGVVFIHA
jgi:hypothetical protein